MSSETPRLTATSDTIVCTSAASCVTSGSNPAILQWSTILSKTVGPVARV